MQQWAVDLELKRLWRASYAFGWDICLIFKEFFHILKLSEAVPWCVCAKVFLCAMQRIRSTVDEKEQKQLLMDLDVVMRSSDCPYIVQFYGALFREVSWSSPADPLHIEMIRNV